MLRLTVKQETSTAVCAEEVTFDAYISGNFKVPCGVAIAYIGNDFSKRVLIVGILAVFHPLAYDVAKYAAEVFVAGIGQKLLESVSMPMKLPSMDRFASDFMCASMPDLVSEKHHAAPC